VYRKDLFVGIDLSIVSIVKLSVKLSHVEYINYIKTWKITYIVLHDITLENFE